MSEWQLFKPLPEPVYQALKRDIQRRGVLVPIELDENGAILDGHHRMRACEELGITEYPTVVRSFENDTMRRLHVIALNSHRRHMTTPKWRGWIFEAEQLSLDVGIAPEPAYVDETGVVVSFRKPTPSSSAAHATERQRYHRLRERLRPMTPAPEDADPWEMANAILLLHSSIARNVTDPRVAGLVEEASELLRQLVWGPEGGE